VMIYIMHMSLFLYFNALKYSTFKVPPPGGPIGNSRCVVAVMCDIVYYHYV
jgi:hypothetical protein